MADGKEETVDGQVVVFLVCFALPFHEMGTFHAVFSVESQRIVLKENLDLGIISYTLFHDVGGAEIRLAHNHIYFRTKLGQIGGLLAGSITAAYHGNHFLAVEESVTGSTGRNTLSVIFLFILKPEVFS